MMTRSDGDVLVLPRTGAAQAYDREPSAVVVEAAAKAWLSWQFPGRDWETAVDSMKDRFRDGAKVVLCAAAKATKDSITG